MNCRKKDCSLLHLSTSSFLIVSIIFFSQCVLEKYSTSISESWLMAIAFPTVHLFFSSLAVPFFAYLLILYSSLSPFLLTLCPVPTSYFCQVFGVAIFSDGVNCFDITQQKNIDKNQNVKQTNCLFGS